MDTKWYGVDIDKRKGYLYTTKDYSPTFREEVFSETLTATAGLVVSSPLFSGRDESIY